MQILSLSFSSTLSLALLAVLSACSGGAHAGGHGDPAPATGDGGGVFTSIPNPALIVANGGDGTVSIVDPSSMVVASTVAVASGLHPHHIGLAPDRSRALIVATSTDLSAGHSGAAHAGHGAAAATSVYQLDVESRELRKVITVDATAHNAAFTADGSSIVLGMMEHGMIEAYDATEFELAFAGFGFEMPLEVTPTNTGSVLVAESGASRIAVFDLASQAVLQTFEVGAVPVAAWASGGAHYFVSVEESMLLRHFVEDEQSVTLDEHSLTPGGMPGQAMLTPGGTELWVAVEDRPVLAVFNAESHELLTEIAAGTKPHGIAFDPDGSRAFVTDEEGGRLLVVDVGTRAVSGEIAVGAKPNGIVWLQR